MDRSSGDTIFALSSGPGPAAIGIFRISGPQAFEVGRSSLPNLPPASELQPRRLYLSSFVDGAGEPVDEVLAVHFPAPHSYTGEDLLEIHAHGGIAILAAVEEALSARGLRSAAPGEFTRRAVQHGRMDLVEAEALATLLEADEPEVLMVARRAWKEGTDVLRSLLQSAMQALAEARGSEDFPLETREELLSWKTQSRTLAQRCKELAGPQSLDRRSLEGVRVVLCGPVNAGKSSLFNALLEEERSLVDAVAGTTRDALSAPIRISGRRVSLYDTAGLRQAEGIEDRGIQRGLATASESDLLIWVEDISTESTHPPPQLQPDLWVENKSDLAPHTTRVDSHARRVSALTGQGLPELRDEIQRRLRPWRETRSARQRRLLGLGEKAFLAASAEGPDDLRTAQLARAVGYLEELFGTGARGPVAEAEVYRRFCIGK